jgi:hypothetical protein
MDFDNPKQQNGLHSSCKAALSVEQFEWDKLVSKAIHKKKQRVGFLTIIYIKIKSSYCIKILVLAKIAYD